MAEKGFGVKEINLIGASGTPTIESPNNLNLNAVNVAISTNATIGGTLAVTGNVSVGGTLTYEDVTSIDSVGIVTARDGVVVVGRGVSIAAGGLNVTAGVGTFAADIYANSGQIRKNSVIWLSKDGGEQCSYTAGTTGGGGTNHLFRTFNGGSTQDIIRFDFGAKIGIAGANYGSSGQVLTSGGSGSAASWSDVSITPTNSDIQVAYTVTANGSSAYRFAGNGVVSTADDPDLYLIRGQKYRFINNSGGSHPFQIREASGGTAYSTGVTNNGASSGNIDFAPTYDSPAQLVYQCTNHGSMVGNIYLRDAAGGNTNVGVTTFSNKITVESSTNTIANFKGSGGAGFIQITDADDGSLAFIGVDGGAIKLQTSGSSYSDKLVIATDGDIGVGVASPDGRFHIMGGNLGGAGSVTADTAANLLVLESNTSQGMSLLNANDERANIRFGTTGTGGQIEAGIQYAHEAVSTTADRRAMIFRAGGGERARIQTGRLLVGRTNPITITGDGSSHVFEQLDDNGYGVGIHCDESNQRGLGIYYNTGRNPSDAIRFVIGSSAKFIVLGSGNVQNANNSYGNISDVSLKENIVDAGSQWNDIKNIKIRNYNFKESTGQETHKQIGVVAQELETVCPKLVSTDQDGMKNVASSVLYMKAVKALQEAMAKIETLEAEVAALKAK